MLSALTIVLPSITVKYVDTYELMPPPSSMCVHPPPLGTYQQPMKPERRVDVSGTMACQTRTDKGSATVIKSSLPSAVCTLPYHVQISYVFQPDFRVLPSITAA